MLSTILHELADGSQEPGKLCPDPRLLEGAIQVIMRGQATATETAALLMGLRCRGENAEHLKAVVEVMLEHAVKFPRPDVEVLVDTCGPGGVGRGTVNVSSAAALLAATAGVPVAKHGNRSVSSKSGSADVLEALGIKIDCSPETSAACLRKHNFAFLFAPIYHPAMKHAGPIRKEIKIRTIFNLAGPLSNPAGPTHQLVGVGRRSLMEPIAEALRLLGRKRALIVHGRNGLDEVGLDQVTEGLLLTEDGNIKSISFEPRDFGVEPIERADLVIDSPADSANKIRAVLEGAKGPIADEINANVAAVLLLTDRAQTIEQGFMIAREVQQSGKGMEILKAIAAMTQQG